MQVAATQGSRSLPTPSSSAYARGRRLRAGVRGALAAGALLVACTAPAGADGPVGQPKPFEGFDGVPGEWTEVLNGYVRDPKTYGPRLIAIERESGGNLPPIFQMATADAYLRAGNRRAAEGIFEQSLTQNLGYPWSDFANIGLGTIRLTSGDEDAAIDYFGRVAESEEASAQALGNLGMGAALSASGRFAEAQEAFAETASIDTVEAPVRDAGRFGSAMALYGAGSFDAAARAFDEIARSAPDGTLGEDARYAAARARIAMGDRNGSATALRELVATCDPKSAGHRAPRAMRNLDARAMGRNWLRNYRRTGWSSISEKGGTMYSIGGCALAKSTLRALERGDASVGGAVLPVAAAGGASAPAAVAAAPAKGLPPAAPAPVASSAGWTPIAWLVAGIAVLLVLWRVLARRAAARGLVAALLLASAGRAHALSFTDVTAAAGLAATVHGYATEGAWGEPGVVAGGVAAGDYDRDGFVDLFFIRGQLGAARLFRNAGNGTFADVTASSGITVGPGLHSSATFADVDGDGWLDLLVVGFESTAPILWHNEGDGTFSNATAGSGLTLPGEHAFSASFGDYDRDGDLDLFVSLWTSELPLSGPHGHLWQNDGSGRFADVSAAAGVPIFASPIFPANLDMSFTGNFADIDSDGWPDLLVSADFGASRVLHNDGDGTFSDVTDPAVVTDENGMGSAIGDYDEDGDLDWFVSSIWDPNGIVEGHWRISGNRLYRNAGDGTFSDVTDAAGVRVGYWGWGSTFADLDDDGHLDLIHVNGWGPRDVVDSAEFHADPARVFLSNGDGTFTESAAALGAADTGEGRGVVAFDYDRDGDVDLLYANNSGAPVLLRNDGGNTNASLSVKLLGRGGNREAIGARVRATVGAATQMRELRAGSNFESQDPAEAHFGLGAAPSVDQLRVTWPDGTETTIAGVPADAALVLSQPQPGGPDCTGVAPGNACIPGGVASSRTDCIVEWLVTPRPPLGPGGIPSRTVLCRDGDPACDADGAADGACTLGLALCVNATDPRLPRCAPTDVATLAVTAPRKTSRKQLERDVHAQLAGAFGATGELGVGSAAVRANATPNFCTASVPLRIPLATSAAGAQRPTKLRVGVKAQSSRAGGDSDVLSLQCLPPL